MVTLLLLSQVYHLVISSLGVKKVQATEYFHVIFIQGDVELRDLDVKESALDELDLPVRLVFGHIGKCRMKTRIHSVLGPQIALELAELMSSQIHHPKHSIISWNKLTATYIPGYLKLQILWKNLKRSSLY